MTRDPARYLDEGLRWADIAESKIIPDAIQDQVLIPMWKAQIALLRGVALTLLNNEEDQDEPV